MFKLIDKLIPATPPAFDLHSEKSAQAGDTLTFTVSRVPDAAPALTLHWDFGDGTTGDGLNVHHAYTNRRPIPSVPQPPASTPPPPPKPSP
jgi:hypothetical protein